MTVVGTLVRGELGVGAVVAIGSGIRVVSGWVVSKPSAGSVVVSSGWVVASVLGGFVAVDVHVPDTVFPDQARVPLNPGRQRQASPGCLFELATLQGAGWHLLFCLL